MHHKTGIHFSIMLVAEEHIMTSKWLINYYMNESSYKAGIVAMSETITGDRFAAVNWATNKTRYSQFKFYDIIPLN